MHLTLLDFAAVHWLTRQGDPVGKLGTEGDEPCAVQSNAAGAVGDPVEDLASISLESGWMLISGENGWPVAGGVFGDHAPHV